MSTITTTELADRLSDDAVTILDVRPLAAYNGWRLRGERARRTRPRSPGVPVGLAAQRRCSPKLPGSSRRRASCPGARSPSSATATSDVGAGRRPAACARHRGRPRPRGRGPGLGRRSVAPARTSAQLRPARHDRLAEGRPRRRQPEAAPTGRFLLFHVNFGVPEEYAEGHIAGRSYLDTNWLEDPVDWNRRSPEALDEALRSLGITRDTTVVVYGRDTIGGANEKWPGRRRARSPRPAR
jgi:thiosulfate/3-mercaptopyruvate sulfurtransferase